MSCLLEDVFPALLADPLVRCFLARAKQHVTLYHSFNIPQKCFKDSNCYSLDSEKDSWPILSQLFATSLTKQP